MVPRQPVVCEKTVFETGTTDTFLKFKTFRKSRKTLRKNASNFATNFGNSKYKSRLIAEKSGTSFLFLDILHLVSV